MPYSYCTSTSTHCAAGPGWTLGFDLRIIPAYATRLTVATTSTYTYEYTSSVVRVPVNKEQTNAANERSHLIGAIRCSGCAS